MSSRYLVARAATVRSSSETSQSVAGCSTPRCSPPVATVACAWVFWSACMALVVVSSWAMTMAGAPSCGRRARMSVSA
nr:hypothetical protein [Glycomyces harbinensis]